MKPKKIYRGVITEADKFARIVLKEMITAKLIFDEIDNAIEECKTKKPVDWDKSQFKKLYEEIKAEWTQKI